LDNIKYIFARSFENLFRFKSLAISDFIFQNVPPETYLERNIFGYKMQLDVSRSSVQRLLYLQGERFINEKNLIKQLVKPGMRVIDVGANIGYYTLMFNIYMQGKGHVLCFEPEPNNFVELKNNVEINKFNNVEINQVALGDLKGLVNLSPGINGNIVDHNSDTIEVPITTLDSYISQGVDMIKIDVEGYEFNVLNGCRKLITKYHPILFIEIHSNIKGRENIFEKVYILLKNYYDNIHFYQNYRGDSTVMKILSKYLNIFKIDEMSDANELINKCNLGNMKDTFWMVCLP